MKIVRAIIFTASIALIIWFLGPLYKGVVHIGMLYPLPVLALFAFFSVRPDLLRLLFVKFKVLSVTIASLLGIGIIVFCTMVGIMLAYANNTPQPGSTVVVLGCQVIGKTPSLMLYDRMEAALEYIEDNPDSKIIASGGQGPGEDISEAQAIKDYLVSNGVSPDRIYVEDKSANTNENIEFSAKIIEKNGLNKNIAVVTDGFHQFRASYFSSRNNLESSAVSCNTRWYFSLSYYSREVLAIIKMKIF